MKYTSRRGISLWALVCAFCLLPFTFSLVPFPFSLDLNSGAAFAQSKLKGDAASGRTLIESNKCLDCHRIEERGSRVGPDLSDIAAARSGEQLQRAIVAPDEEVIPDNRQIRIVTKDGTTVSGKLLNQDAFSIQLLNTDEQLKTYQKSGLREHTIVQKGLMPSYEGRLTAQQVADIVSYLQSLDGEAEPSAVRGPSRERSRQSECCARSASRRTGSPTAAATRASATACSIR